VTEDKKRWPKNIGEPCKNFRSYYIEGTATSRN